MWGSGLGRWLSCLWLSWPALTFTQIQHSQPHAVLWTWAGRKLQGCSDCPDPRLRGTHTLEILIVKNENKPRDTALNSLSQHRLGLRSMIMDWTMAQIPLFIPTNPYQLSLVQPLSHVRLFATPWITARQASLSTTNSWSVPKPMSIESVMPSSHLILCRPLLLLPLIPPSIKGLFQWVNSLHQVAKVLEFQLQHQFYQWTPRTDLL